MKNNHSKFEKKWQGIWEKEGVYRALDSSEKPKFYCLVEFPYPSGTGLHIGHPRSYTAMDVIARKRRAQGFNVLYPIGWDAFGLPTENYAIKNGLKPQEVTEMNIANFRRQLKELGLSFDWNREVNTTDPEYYKWTQWMFLEFFDAGLAYKKKMAINWCGDCKTGLANEEVVNGGCERCGGIVEKRDKEQWMIGITKYADRLIDDLGDVDYLEKIAKQQIDWIGRSEGARVEFDLDGDLTGVRVLGLHAFKDDSHDAFWDWLKGEVKNRGGDLTVLDLPDSSAPDIEKQVEYILENFKFDEGTVIVTHSLGGVAAMKLLPRLDVRIAKLVMAAPPLRVEFLDGVERPALDDACDWRFDFEAISEKVSEVVVLADEDDPIVPREHVETIARELMGELRVVRASSGHFNGEREREILGSLIGAVEVFTTRPDTLFGATYMVLAPENPLVGRIVGDEQRDEVRAYVAAAAKKSDIERGDDTREKTGVFSGAYVLNPVNGERIPIWIADYVLAGYGTGAIMAVPAHDSRDYAFAKKFGLDIIEVVSGGDISDEAYTGDGKLINSGFLNGLSVEEGKVKMVEWLEERGVGGRQVNYRLRDWVFSRQRYWGEPIPLVHCEGGCAADKGGWVPLDLESLPLELPDVDRYEPTDTGESPLAGIDEWVNTKCPQCGGAAKRETDTMPNWAGSSWYFLRYVDPHNTEVFASKDKLDYWMPVDWYNGGMEHTTLHLLYSRFWNKFLADRGHVPVFEPYVKRTSHGLILAADGTKMSKSKGNGVNPSDIVDKFGADVLRVYELFIGPFSEPVPWNDNGLVGVKRFLDKVAKMTEYVSDNESEEITRGVNKMIKKVGEDIDALRFNTAVSAMMIFVNNVFDEKAIGRGSFEAFLKMLSFFAPHLCEEIWHELGNDGLIVSEDYPEHDEAMVADDVVVIGVQVNGKVRGEVELAVDASEDEAKAAALANANVAKFIDGKEIRKFVYVPGRIVNVVV